MDEGDVTLAETGQMVGRVRRCGCPSLSVGYGRPRMVRARGERFEH